LNLLRKPPISFDERWVGLSLPPKVFKMNMSETNFYSWLIRQGYDSSEITYQASKTPDFIGSDKNWEVKKLYGNQIMIRSKVQADFVEDGGEKDFIAIMPENPKEDKDPVAIVPCSELRVDGTYKVKDLERWNLTGEISLTHIYPQLRIKPTFKYDKGERISVYFKDEDLLGWIEEQVDKGKYRNLSHAVEKAVEGEKRRSISY